MEAVKVRKSTAFRLDNALLERLKTEAKRENRSLNSLVDRLDNALLERLKTEAKRENRSLNSLVEAILMDAMYCVPNAERVQGNMREY